MLRYRKLRGDCQEVYYNVGRLLHQFGIFAGAVHMYERVLRETNVPSVQIVDEQTGEVRCEMAERCITSFRQGDLTEHLQVRLEAHRCTQLGLDLRV